MIEIRGSLKYKRGSTPPPTEDIADTFIRQISYDAVHGTFGEFPPYWRDKWERKPAQLVGYSVKQQADKHTFDFELRLSEDFFPVQPAGFQHLIGVLAGDLFYPSVPGVTPETISVNEVVLPAGTKSAAAGAFRGTNRAHEIDDIRAQFKLGDKPLLAFSFKPRMGVKFKDLESVTLGVLKSGFNLVELDTRNLQLDENRVSQLIDLAAKAAALSTRDHMTRFSPNLSVPADRVTELAVRFVNAQPSPVVIKIDGGLDGISACQAVRRKFHGAAENSMFRRPPVITCYPLLRNILSGRVPPGFFVEALALSGVDIIYPGGRPSLGSGGRTLLASERGTLINSVGRYRKLVSNKWPMPTVAGGVYVGELHAFYELLGPSVAYFLGGAVALHKGGPIEGAKLCAEVIREAVELRKRNPNEEVAGSLSDGLVRRIEDAYDRRKLPQEVQFAYIQPGALIESTRGLDSWFVTNS